MGGNNEPGKKLGGNELPPELQDRPEQNRGYDEAVAGRSGRPGAMQVGTSGVIERRREAEEAAEGSDASAGDAGRGRPAPDKAEG
jgi:hypothetical protein